MGVESRQLSHKGLLLRVGKPHSRDPRKIIVASVARTMGHHILGHLSPRTLKARLLWHCRPFFKLFSVLGLLKVNGMWGLEELTEALSGKVFKIRKENMSRSKEEWTISEQRTQTAVWATPRGHLRGRTHELEQQTLIDLQDTPCGVRPLLMLYCWLPVRKEVGFMETATHIHSEAAFLLQQKR